MEIHQAVKKLLAIVDALQQRYPKKRFTLDGRLVGDIGEILVERDYDLALFDKLEKHYDATTPGGRKVQIKTTMKNALNFPCDHTPDFYLGIKVSANGTYEEIFNGPGELVREAIKKRKPTKINSHSISLSALRALNKNAPEESRIRWRQHK